MNRFRTKKKAKDDSAPRPSHDSESSTPFRLFGKSKKTQEEEPKKEIDLSTALPSNDDFRTSLLMTGLSARFSMLKEQDDPTTKIGKASDDSVLFPKRQSRLDFGFGLGDIAEVESIRSKPPYARIDSFHSSDGSTSGSVLDRAKPTEGNNLFGGRQKIYKIPAGKNGDGVLRGKALYEDDVAVSSFQRWRQAEKAKSWQAEQDEPDTQGKRHDQDEQPTLGSDVPRSESPHPVHYNRKRETNSTTSSAPSANRDSTAATSITSQPTPSVKDWQSAPTSNSATGTPALERTVTRTRRLYETGLMNDLQEQQSSALSRIDTLSRPRHFGARTPELSSGPSPTTNHNLFTERFGDKKVLVGKSSVPNMRSMSPPTTGSSLGTMDLGIRIPSGGAENKPSCSSSSAPPLSPPVSEAEETSPLQTQPNDRGKASALGIFQKPAHAYDEAKYAQKQIQLQQGRETPTNRFRAESTTSYTNTVRSRSSSSVYRQPLDRADSPAVHTELTVTEEETGASCDSVHGVEAERDDPPRRPPLSRNGTSSSSSQSNRPRPSDLDHPAFREPSRPAPLLLHSSNAPEESSSASEKVDAKAPDHRSPVDSPTLGPASGLSGIVRQHLRSDSDASSVYGFPTSDSARTFYDAYMSQDAKADWDAPTRPSDSQPSQPQASLAGHEAQLETKLKAIQERLDESARPSPAATPQPGAGSDTDRENEDFAKHLADGARRVRERLTSYVGLDSRSVSPQPPETRDGQGHPSRPNALNLLRTKSSRGSLVDGSRSRDPEREREPERELEQCQSTKAMKMLGIGLATMSSSPSPNKRSFELERDLLSPMYEEAEGAPVEPESKPPSPPQAQPQSQPPTQPQPPTSTQPQTQPQTQAETQLRAQHDPQAEQHPEAPPAWERREIEEEKSEGMHAGLRAFRQARRELQRLKEAEIRQRRQQPGALAGQAPGAPGDSPTPSPVQSPPQPLPSGQPPAPSAHEHQRLAQQSPSRERRPPPSSMNYQYRVPSEEARRNGSRPPSQTQQRDRSGSENSAGSRSRSRPPALRNPAAPYDGLSPNGAQPQPRLMTRSPGLPGTDIRRSPLMPSPGYHAAQHPSPGQAPSGPLPGAPSGYFDRSVSGNLRGQLQPRVHESGQASPISPISPMPSPYVTHSGAGTPTTLGPSSRRPSAPPTPNLDVYGNTTQRVDDPMRRTVRKRDISEPTFVSSTSRVPTVNLPEEQHRVRAGSGTLGSSASNPNLDGSAAAETSSTHAPPLPPLNPRRRNMTGPSQRSPDEHGLGLAPPSLVPGESDRNSAFSHSDDEDAPVRERRKLRKSPSEMGTMNVKARQAQFGGGVRAAPPPLSTPPMNSPRMPGGMI
ncbi:hypothetical protein SODALDRAFT_20843 [Sodiomyces alkalinus F11]|uniref:Uncharacterized protein n=1 Tax=Sodiomyces alkalinus (strain CBS 110278 / VKM F-3762 / F11) TaxID=1314773 RepID=A0A3N2Q7K4_SODAK|nr:hypothetical protein SODALDRAFT_20843 [Sodiomyces alkalinus F11]ROT42686.1 hypothetical protein SODALDRAFT_20843 [Sodiomyces alkalinus F11]